jgi:hypothetical protein
MVTEVMMANKIMEMMMRTGATNNKSRSTSC